MVIRPEPPSGRHAESKTLQSNHAVSCTDECLVLVTACTKAAWAYARQNPSMRQGDDHEVPPSSWRVIVMWLLKGQGEPYFWRDVAPPAPGHNPILSALAALSRKQIHEIGRKQGWRDGEEFEWREQEGRFDRNTLHTCTIFLNNKTPACLVRHVIREKMKFSIV